MTAAVEVAMMLTYRGWVEVELPGGCTGWNDAHDCRREDDHPGDHVCGCHDQWNRGEWDDCDEEDAAYFESFRPERRCCDDEGDWCPAAQPAADRVGASG